jgi:tRNA U34 5-methylaminomethyl-2-thiouridine-forming methyltransferase MnmC
MTSKKTPPGHRWIETEDGSMTLFSDQFQESCHSTAGAMSETELHYIKGCRVAQRAPQHETFVILEVGFGLGLGLAATQECMKDIDCNWHFISLELDRDLVEWWRGQNSEAIWVEENVLELRAHRYTLTILVGDARELLPAWATGRSVRWHAIYQDAFSPRRNPTLWTTEWFSFLRNYSTPDVILSTYSSSSSIRKSLHEAGWLLKKGEKFGPKRSSTRATLQGETDEEILIHMARSPMPALSDANAQDFRLKGP